MNPETVTFASGVVLLLVFALVGWNVRRRPKVRDRKSDDPDRTASP